LNFLREAENPRAERVDFIAVSDTNLGWVFPHIGRRFGKPLSSNFIYPAKGAVMTNQPHIKWMLAAISFAWAATTSPAISLAGSVSKQPPSPSIESLTQSADEAANSGDYWTALSLYRRLAEKGDARAQYKLGAMVQDENLKEAAKWYQLAAAQGNGRARD
jgi:hypothetical protein